MPHQIGALGPPNGRTKPAAYRCQRRTRSISRGVAFSGFQQQAFGIRAAQHTSVDQFTHGIGSPIQSGVAGALPCVNDDGEDASDAALVMAVRDK
jgi:hypothetical protein